jgi:hypothetical protein
MGMTVLPCPSDAARITRFLQDQPRWSIYWDKKHGLWRVAEDDPTPISTPKAATRTR